MGEADQTSGIRDRIGDVMVLVESCIGHDVLYETGKNYHENESAVRYITEGSLSSSPDSQHMSVCFLEAMTRGTP